MPANIKTASFTDPAMLIAPDLTVQQQQVARQQALADAMRQQSMQDIPTNGGQISWTQGLAKALQAWTAGRLQKNADAKSLDIAKAYGAKLGGMFGAGQGGIPGGVDPGMSSDQARAMQPADPTLGPQTNALLAALKARQAPPANGSPETPPGAASPSGGGSPAGPVTAAPPAPGPWSLTGNPQQDMSLYMLSPEKYGEQVIASRAPTDIAKNLIAQGLQPGTPEFQAALAQVNRKQSFIEPTNLRPGGTAVMNDGSGRMIYSPQVPEGYAPKRDANGNVTGIVSIPGGPQAVRDNAAAKSFGNAAGDMVQVFDPATNQMVYRPKQAVLQGGGAAGPSLGAQAAYNVTGTNSANAFQAISDGAADVPNRIYALKNMGAIVADPKSVMGPGSETWNKITGTLATLTGGQAPNMTNAQEFNKWAAQYSARSAQELGLSGSDARVQIAIHATPNGEMTKPALLSVIPQMIGIENAKQGYANAADAWQRQNGPQSVQTFRTQWNKVYDPQVYTLMAQGPQAFAAAVAHMPKQQAAQLRAKYMALKNMGALPQ